jgi:hypothetical protein
MKMIQVIAISLMMFLIGPAVGQGQPNYQPITPSQHDHPEVPRITAFEAMEFYKQGKLILANAHERGTYARGHIVGSFNLPNGEVQNKNISLPTNLIVAFYCA